MGETRRPLKVGLHLPEIERVARWNEIEAMCRLAEDVGFDSIWVPDHLLYQLPDRPVMGPWECWSILAAVAAVTKRVEIGPLVLCTNFRNPALIAKMAETVDEISGGRLILGLGAGWHQPEYDAFGYPYESRFGRFVEAFKIISTLLRDGEIDFEGKYFTLRECEIRPRGPRPGGIPLMIGSRGDQVLRASLADVEYWNAWYVWCGNRAAGLSPYREQVDAACVDVGKDPANVKRTVAVLVAMPNAEQPANPDAPAIGGSTEEIANALRDFGDAGVSHLQVVLDPNTEESIAAFAPVLEMLDRA